MTKEQAELLAEKYNEKNKPSRALRAYVTAKTLQPETKYNEEITSYEVIYPVLNKPKDKSKKIKSKHARGKRMLTIEDLRPIRNQEAENRKIA